MIPYDKEYGLRVKEGAKCNAGKSKGCWFNFPNIVRDHFGGVVVFPSNLRA